MNVQSAYSMFAAVSNILIQSGCYDREFTVTGATGRYDVTAMLPTGPKVIGSLRMQPDGSARYGVI